MCKSLNLSFMFLILLGVILTFGVYKIASRANDNPIKDNPSSSSIDDDLTIETEFVTDEYYTISEYPYLLTKGSRVLSNSLNFYTYSTNLNHEYIKATNNNSMDGYLYFKFLTTKETHLIKHASIDGYIELEKPLIPNFYIYCKATKSGYQEMINELRTITDHL